MFKKKGVFVLLLSWNFIICLASIVINNLIDKLILAGMDHSYLNSVLVVMSFIGLYLLCVAVFNYCRSTFNKLLYKLFINKSLIIKKYVKIILMFFLVLISIFGFLLITNSFLTGEISTTNIFEGLIYGLIFCNVINLMSYYSATYN